MMSLFQFQNEEVLGKDASENRPKFAQIRKDSCTSSGTGKNRYRNFPKYVRYNSFISFAEETVLAYKQVCSTIHKKLCEYIPSAGKGTDGQSVERRLKKTSDFLLGQSLSV